MGITLWLGLTTLGISLGNQAIGFQHLWAALNGDQILPHYEVILWNIRLPRTLMAGITGAGLAMVGATIQAMVRNPMADPWILGVSSGASLGAVLAMTLGLATSVALSTQALAFIGAVVASGLVYVFAARDQGLSSTRLILVGLALSFLFGALTQLAIFAAPHSAYLKSVLFWTLGSLGDISLSSLVIPAIVTVATFILLLLKSEDLNLCLLGDEKAFSMGLSLQKLRRNLFFLCALTIAVLVAETGTIGFVGLIIPHLLRLMIGSDYRLLIPACFVYGGCFLMLADLGSRLLFNPEELPIGVLTAICGSPVLIYLLRRDLA